MQLSGYPIVANQDGTFTVYWKIRSKTWWSYRWEWHPMFDRDFKSAKAARKALNKYLKGA